uniref:Signal recognition particle subunit SRP68 n=1 Tax=Trichuris muris TaxID=70415 RepID=A0A5S6QE69_TRIMR
MAMDGGFATVHILQLVKEAQQQHGLRHGDYQRYRQYCSRKLRRVRKSLKLTSGHESRSVRKLTAGVARTPDPKHLSLFVFEADRCWAYAMQLKQEAAPDNRKKFHLMRKMRAAVRNCHNLERACKEMENLDAATKLEVGAYSSWMQGCLHFEAKMWSNAAECFTTAKTIYQELSSITDSPALVDVYEQRCREIDPPLRFCQFSIGDSSALADLVQMRLQISDQPESTLLPDLNKLLTECRQKQANPTELEVVWCGRKVNFSKSVRTQSFYNSLLDLERQIEEVTEIDAKISLYEQALSECRDVMQCVREEAKGEVFKVKVVEGEQYDKLSHSNVLFLYLSYIRLRKSIERYVLMVEHVQRYAKKPQEAIRLYDLMLQNFSELQMLPLVQHDESFTNELSFFRALRCCCVADVFASQNKWLEALALFKRTLSYVDGIRMKGSVPSESFGCLTNERLRQLLMEASKGMYCSHVKCARVSEGKETAERSEKVDEPIMEHLDVFYKLSLADLKERVKLVRIPPNLQPIACKPLFFDLAFNYVHFPVILDDAVGKADGSKENQKAGGLGNLVRVYLNGVLPFDVYFNVYWILDILFSRERKCNDLYANAGTIRKDNTWAVPFRNAFTQEDNNVALVKPNAVHACARCEVRQLPLHLALMDQIEAAGVEVLEQFVRVCPRADTTFVPVGGISFDSLRCDPFQTAGSRSVEESPTPDGRHRAEEKWKRAYGHVLDMHYSDPICRWQTSAPMLGSGDGPRPFNRGSLDVSVPVDEEAGRWKKNEDLTCRVLFPATPSFMALKKAVLNLYRMEDFTLEPLGEGFFSEVYKVCHVVTGDVLVLKLNKVSSNRSNVLREVELMRKLRHPNVLRFRGACVDNGQMHALTEYCEVGGLDLLIASDEWSQLAWSVRVGLALDVSRGMEYIHSCGYMHRDLTSKNILCKRVGARLVAVIGDLGLACRIPFDSSKKLPVAGTPYWMAPECLNEEFYCEMADVFSYGIILCEMIAQIEADPDVMPRTATFGLDYIRYSELCPQDAPLDFVKLAFRCCLMDPDCRPKFVRIVPHVVALLKMLLRRDGGVCLSTGASSGSLTRGYRTKMSRRSSEVGLDSITGRLPHVNGFVSMSTSKEVARKDRVKYAELSCGNPVASVALARHIAAVDPFYQPMPPQSGNPFLTHKRFADGQKIYTESYFVKRRVVSPPDNEARVTDLQVTLGDHVSPSGSAECRIRRCCSLPCSASCSICKSASDAPDYVNANFCMGEEGLGLCRSDGLFLDMRENVPQQFFEEDRLFVNSKVCNRRQRIDRSSTPLIDVYIDQSVLISGDEGCSNGNVPQKASIHQEATRADGLPLQRYFAVDRTELNQSSYVFASEPTTSERTYLGYAKPTMSTFLCPKRVPDGRPHHCTVWTSSKRCVLL